MKRHTSLEIIKFNFKVNWFNWFLKKGFTKVKKRGSLGQTSVPIRMKFMPNDLTVKSFPSYLIP